MEVKIYNTVSNAETSAVLQTLGQLLEGNEILHSTETKDVPGTKGAEIIISIACTLAMNISSAFIYDLLKTAFRRRFGNKSSEEAQEVKISIEIDGEKEDEVSGSAKLGAGGSSSMGLSGCVCAFPG